VKNPDQKKAEKTRKSLPKIALYRSIQVLSAATSSVLLFSDRPLLEEVAVLLLALSAIILAEMFLKLDRDSRNTIRGVEKRFEQIFRLGPAPIAISRLADGTFVDMNQMYLDLFGYSREQMVGHNSIELGIITPEERLRLIERLKAKGSASSVSLETKTRDNKKKHVLFSSEILDLGGEAHMLSILFDVTERTEAQRALEEREKDLTEAQEIAKLGAWIFNPAEKTAYVSAGFEQIHRRNPLPRVFPIEEYFSSVPDEDRSGIEKSIQTILATGRHVTVDHRVKLSEKETRWMNLRMDAARDGFGNMILRAVSQDITDRVKLEGQLRQSQKLDAMGQLAGGIAHDLNNTLGVILGHLAMAEEDLPPDHSVQENLRAIHKATQRGADMVRRILSVCNARPAEGIISNPGAVIKETIALLRSSLPVVISIRESLEENMPAIRGDSTQLHQIIMNLATNASHALEGRMDGHINIELKSTRVDADAAAVSSELKEGLYCCLSVSDNGSGMDRQTMDRILEPFFTTKPAGKGTGLGLSIVHGIVRSYGGALTVYSEPGRGTTFRIYLPALSDAAGQDRDSEEELVYQGKGEHILCVDDEGDLLNVTGAMLVRMGYRVSKFTNPLEALESLKAESYDLLLTDQSMPFLSGSTLAGKAKAMYPDLPVILVSGNFVDQDIKEAEELKLYRLLKPATKMDLSRILQNIFSSDRKVL